MYQLQNAQLLVTFDSNAGITGILDKRNGREYIENKQFVNGWRLMLPTRVWDGRFADGCKQTDAVATPGEKTIEFVFSDIVAEDQSHVNIELTVTYCLENDELHAAYTIKNMDKEEFVSHVMFPVMNGIGKKSAEMNLVTPEQSPFGDTRIENPFSYGDGNHKDWVRACNRKSVRYPLQLVTAWMDYSDEFGGVALEQRSSCFALCDFGFERMIQKDKNRREKNKDFLQLALQSYPNAAFGEERRSPDYVIEIHEGNWQTPALRHRNWLKEQIVLPQIPEDLKRSLGWHFFFMKQQDGTTYFTYKDMESMAASAKEAGLNHMMVFGWYPAGHDNDYPFGYFVNEDWGGAGELKKQLSECQKKGCGVIPFFNGTLVDISMNEYKEYAARWPVLGRTGKPYCGTEFSRANNDMGFSNACIPTSTRNTTLLDVCITSDEVKEWWKESIYRIVKEYGFQNIQLDQIAHKSYVCYDPSHKHRRPETAWTEELMELLTEIRSIVKNDNRDAVIIGEGMTDMTMQYCDAFWNWHQAFNRPEIIRYSVPWMNYSHEVDANEYDAVNLCFAERILLDLKIEGGTAKVTDYPDFSKHLKGLSRLKKRLGAAYIEGEYCYQDDMKVENSEGILVRMYKYRTDAAVVIADTSGKEGFVSVTLEQSLYGVRLYSNYGEKETEEKRSFTLSVMPYEVMVLEGCRIKKT